MKEKIYNTASFRPIIVKSIDSGKRLDRLVSESLSEYSRSQIKHWILNKQVIINNLVSICPKKKVIPGEIIEIKNIDNFDMDYHNSSLVPQNIILNIVYEDNDIVVINKPSNMVVHPGSGNYKNTILNALLYRYPSILKISKRAGIVQRLDKDTTGLMVIAKTHFAYHNLLVSFKMRQVIKEYDAIVFGHFDNSSGIINQPIRRHSVKRTCMTVHAFGKSAITQYYVIESFNNLYSRIRVILKTGRTHQIRVHLAYIDHPLVGDQKYNNKFSFDPELYSKLSSKLYTFLSCFRRQALHACTLQLIHPISKKKMRWHAPIPQDIQTLIKILRSSHI